MRVLWLLIFLTLNGRTFAQQGVYIPPRNQKAEPTIVSMSLGDNIVPLIEIGPNGPTIVKFPGKIVSVVIDSLAYNWQEIAPKDFPNGGKLFSYISFSESKALNTEQKSFLAKNNVTVVVIYLYKGIEYVHDIDLVRRPGHRRSFVALVPTSEGVPGKSDVLKKFEGKFQVIDNTIDSSSNDYRLKGHASALGTFEEKGFTVEGGKL